MIRTLSALGSLALAFIATAQPRIVPQNFAWRVQPTSDGTYQIVNDPNFVNIASVAVYTAAQGDPTQAANALASLIETDIVNGKLAQDGSNLTIILHGWGHDHEGTNYKAGGPCP